MTLRSTRLSRIRRKTAEVERISDQVLKICEQTEAVLFRGGSYLEFPATSIAQKLNLPCFEGSLLPLVPTHRYPNIYVTNRTNLPGWLNRLSHTIFRQLSWQAFRPPINRFRSNRLGLKPLPVFRSDYPAHPVLHGFSETVLPRPEDWPETAQISGYWFLDAPKSWSPPAELVRFIETDPPPIYLGFGSMGTLPAPLFLEKVVILLRSRGIKVVLAADASSFHADSLRGESLFVLKEAPHDWIFPRMSVIIHHGGAGTTGSSLRAGVPNVILPHKYDQLFWGQIVKNHGAGPDPIPVQKATPERLTAAIENCLADSRIIDSAKRIGQALRRERGTSKAASYLGRCFSGFPVL